MISMNLLRRAVALIAAAAMAALVAAAASACGGAATSTATPTNGLEKKSAADVLQETAAALEAAKSVHIVGTSPSSGQILDARMQGRSSTGTLALPGVQFRFTIIGNIGYIKADQAALKKLGLPQQIQRHDAGRWLEIRAQDFTGLTLPALAPQLTTYQGPLVPKVRQATLNGRKAVVVSWRNGGKLYVANTGPAYPLRGELKGQNAGRLEFTDYGAPLHITAPSNAIDIRPL
jgi:hypothetical protein